MKTNRLSALLAGLLLLAAPLHAGVVGAPIEGIPAIPALAMSAMAPASFNSNLDGMLADFNLRGFKTLAPTIQTLTAAYEKQGQPEQRLVLAALAQPSVDVAKALQAAGVPAVTAQRMAAVVAKAQASSSKDPALAAALQAAGKAVASPAAGESSAAFAKAKALVDSIVSSWSKSPAASAPSAPVVVAPAPAPADGSRLSDADLLNPAKRPQVKYGTESLPIIALPSEGTDISQLWLKAHAQANGATIVAYNFDDMDMAKSIVARASAGEKITFVGDYSNWFPERMPQAKHGGQTTPQTEAMKFVIANIPAMGKNFDFYILKGIGDIGINHNKFTVFNGPAGKLLQGGSFNYTKTSQLNHWEVVVFSNDAERIDAFERYAAWLTRRARRYSADLEPEDPKFDPADPLPTVEASKELTFHGVPFPKVMFSPNGEGESILTKAISLVQKHLGIQMFSPFPTPSMVAAIEALLGRKISADMVADSGQLANATPVVGLVDAGMPVKEIKGPDVEVQHLPGGMHSKQHEKDMLFDADLADGLVKMADSLNISRNAFGHNFENIQLWNGFYAQFMAAHYRMVWGLAHDLPAELIAKLRAKLESEKAGRSAVVGPWNGTPAEDAPVASVTPKN